MAIKPCRRCGYLPGLHPWNLCKILHKLFLTVLVPLTSAICCGSISVQLSKILANRASLKIGIAEPRFLGGYLPGLHTGNLCNMLHKYICPLSLPASHFRLNCFTDSDPLRHCKTFPQLILVVLSLDYAGDINHPAINLLKSGYPVAVTIKILFLWSRTPTMP